MKQKPFTLAQAMEKARRYCVYQDRCQAEVRRKLADWGFTGDDADQIIVQLISEDFINEERFAKSFARGKFRIKHWGKIKIKYELQKREISDYCIQKGLEEIDADEYFQTLCKLIEKEKEYLADYELTQKLIRKLYNKGYEYELIRNAIEQIK
ncbi:MAG: RecX family transcriptional regulator [Bacteroidetes bacterium]|nr:MAG: RecX family transcriptional regulator [Bacteroidota bacterium]